MQEIAVVQEEKPAELPQGAIADEPKPIAKTARPLPPPPPKKESVQTKPTFPPGDSLSFLLEEKILVFTNTERSRRNLQTLEPNTVLASTARMHSADMLARDYFEHENPDGCSSSCRATNAGYAWRMIGENLYMLEGFDFSTDETAAMIVSGWMESPGHRANILKEGYTETGVGVIVKGSAIYATVLYATPR